MDVVANSVLFAGVNKIDTTLFEELLHTTNICAPLITTTWFP